MVEVIKGLLALKNQEQISKTLYYMLSNLFEISAIYSHKENILFRARPFMEKTEALEQMRKRLVPLNLTAAVSEDNQGLLISIHQTRSAKLPKLNIILFFATLVTMFFAPAILSFDFEFIKIPGMIGERLEFTVALMAILLFHEFGHYLAGRRRGVLMSLPYFIPAPNFVGTFGAVIKTRTPFTNRRDLIEVGATGPIAGFIVSLIALIIGLNNTQIIAVESGGLILGDSLLLKFLAWLIVGPIPEGFDFILSPAAFAGWVGLLVTTINLLPLGQLDGGHIIYGLFGRKQKYISKLFIAFIMVLGLWWMGWWFFGVLVFLFGLNHPPTLNDGQPLSTGAKVMGYISILIFLLCFIPVPFVL